MSILNLIFGSKVKIQKKINDPMLGLLIWESDEEGWLVNYNGFEVILSYEKGNEKPSAELMQYASSMLKSPDYLFRALATAISEFKIEFSEDEKVLDSLEYTVVNFYRYKSKVNRIIASLESPFEERRTWRIEFCEQNCEGLGYDT